MPNDIFQNRLPRAGMCCPRRFSPSNPPRMPNGCWGDDVGFNLFLCHHVAITIVTLYLALHPDIYRTL